MEHLAEAATGQHAADILVVDDSPDNLHLLMRMLSVYAYKVRPVPNGELALQAAGRNPPDLILLDINMPEMDGFEVCRRLKADLTLRDIPVIFLSALTDTQDKVKALALGGVDYMAKPIQFEELHARMQTHLQLRDLRRQLENHNQRLQELVQQQVKEISDGQLATIFALAKLAESRDDDTGKHLERTRAFCRMMAVRLAEHADYQDYITAVYVDQLYWASPLHDIGKVGIPDAVLLKPGKLTPDEFALMKQHTVIGARTLAAVRANYPRHAILNMGIAIARAHHEKWDGSGYPDGLQGGAIPLSARIMALADVYDALRSKRCYKEAFSHEQSLAIIVGSRGTHFDPAMVDAFLAIEGEFATIRREMDDQEAQGD